MNKFSIAITTFSKRFYYVKNLIEQIRKFSEDDILLIINGEKDGKFFQNYRKDILNVCLNFNHIYPIFFIETRGLSKLWNTAIINSSEENILILNDDIEITCSNFFEKIYQHINSSDFTGLTKINNSFSHFIINKNFIDRLGYFDERLLGFGEEDGDITFRVAKQNLSIGNFNIDGLINMVIDTRHDHIKAGIGKYSNFNREFIYNKKYIPNPDSKYQCMFDMPMEQKLDDANQYPYEKFFMQFKNDL